MGDFYAEYLNLGSKETNHNGIKLTLSLTQMLTIAQ